MWRCRINCLYYSYIKKIGKSLIRICEFEFSFSNTHHLPALIYGFFGGKKNIKFLLPTTTIENITCANSLRKASNSLILMAINALAAICLIHLLPLAKF
jgi:hypothetical protein